MNPNVVITTSSRRLLKKASIKSLALRKLIFAPSAVRCCHYRPVLTSPWKQTYSRQLPSNSSLEPTHYTKNDTAAPSILSATFPLPLPGLLKDRAPLYCPAFVSASSSFLRFLPPLDLTFTQSNPHRQTGYLLASACSASQTPHHPAAAHPWNCLSTCSGCSCRRFQHSALATSLANRVGRDRLCRWSRCVGELGLGVEVGLSG